jgi:FkbH-like protein
MMTIKKIIERLIRPEDTAMVEDDKFNPAAGEASAFDSKFYLEAYPDVADAIRQGGFVDAYDHYCRAGRREGRFPKRPTRFKVAESDPDFDALYSKHITGHYLAPIDLEAEQTRLKRVLIIGSCFAEALGSGAPPDVDVEFDFLLAGRSPEFRGDPPKPPNSYDFAIVQLPLRTILADAALWRVSYSDLEAYQSKFRECCQAVEMAVRGIVKWTTGFSIPTFVENFLLPQNDCVGRLLPRYDLRNSIFFIEELNRYLESCVRRFQGAYILDVDKISSSFGRRYLQDDSVNDLAHGSILGEEQPDERRIEPSAPLSGHYEFRSHVDFEHAIWNEAIAMHRTIRQADPVKLVVLDLDDTLWRGVSGDSDETDPSALIEGWPLGVVEALAYLKKRGILLGIISKNDEERTTEFWKHVLRGKFELSDFAAVKINWRPKSENMAEILSKVNLLPSNVVFIDDNPVERSEMRKSFPGMRVLGRHPFYTRRILLWSPETQVESITAESSRRTEMVQAQIEREESRTTLDRSEFLASLSLKIEAFEIDLKHPKFARAFELLNKTNQFNTTGRRWTKDEIVEGVARGMKLYCFEVEDKFTKYGLVGLAMFQGRQIEQFVMSCRVNGMDVEIAAISLMLSQIKGDGPFSAALKETKSNLLCRDFFARCGFEANGDDSWIMDVSRTPKIPDFIASRFG